MPRLNFRLRANVEQDKPRITLKSLNDCRCLRRRYQPVGGKLPTIVIHASKGCSIQAPSKGNR